MYSSSFPEWCSDLVWAQYTTTASAVGGEQGGRDDSGDNTTTTAEEPKTSCGSSCSEGTEGSSSSKMIVPFFSMYDSTSEVDAVPHVLLMDRKHQDLMLAFFNHYHFIHSSGGGSGGGITVYLGMQIFKKLALLQRYVDFWHCMRAAIGEVEPFDGQRLSGSTKYSLFKRRVKDGESSEPSAVVIETPEEHLAFNKVVALSSLRPHHLMIKKFVDGFLWKQCYIDEVEKHRKRRKEARVGNNSCSNDDNDVDHDDDDDDESEIEDLINDFKTLRRDASAARDVDMDEFVTTTIRLGNVDILATLFNCCDGKRSEAPAAEKLLLEILPPNTPLPSLESYMRNYILKHRVDQGIDGDRSWTTLHVATEFGQVKIIRLLVKLGADIETLTKYKARALHIAAINGILPVLKCIVEDAKANPLADAGNGGGALYGASHAGSVDTARYLLDTVKVDLDARSDSGWSAVHAAAAGNHGNVLKLFGERRPDLLTSVGTQFPTSVLGTALRMNSTNALEALIDLGVDCTQKDQRMNRGGNFSYPLIYAVSFRLKDSLKILLARTRAANDDAVMQEAMRLAKGDIRDMLVAYVEDKSKKRQKETE